ncbi:MAG: NUDIX hydrolase [Firmicutes bacterium]|nr:NUDIX hydrolase [Bacillota bacterium]
MQEEVYEHSAGGVVLSQGKVLLVRHARGEWIMPKGHLEPGETPQEAALREIKEETNLDCELGPLVGETRYDFERDGVTVHKKVTWYIARPVKETAVAAPLTSEGILELVWLDPDAAYQRLTFELDRGILRKALSEV